MDEPDETTGTENVLQVNNPSGIKVKAKKRSLVERELETNLTARVTSPAIYGDGMNTSRYGRARRLKTDSDFRDSKIPLEILKSPTAHSPVTVQPPVYRMHASNSPLRSESPSKAGSVETYLESQIENIYQENILLSRFKTEEVVASSPAKKFPKVYIRKDLIQKREPEETIMLIKNIFSPTKSANKTGNPHKSNHLERSSDKSNIKNHLERSSDKSNINKHLDRSSDKYNIDNTKQQNGYIDNSSVVKMLDFDSKKKKKENKDVKSVSKNELFELEAKCLYQVGDLAWARMSTFPFWPCIITRDPATGIFVKKKLFGRAEHDVIHVTFLGDNGRRSWIVENMLRKFLGQLEFESTREQFTLEHKKRDSRLYAAFFVSDKKQPLWNISVEEAEMLLREPKRLRIDIFNDMLEKSRIEKTSSKNQKGEKITRTDSDVSLSESLYDTLFSEDDGKTEDTDRSRNRSRNKSLDVSDVVTACLDNMAAKTGITKIQRQSHMDRWLQKAKSKTPEKVPKNQGCILKNEKESKVNDRKKKKKLSTGPIQKPYSFRQSIIESPNKLLGHQNEHNYSKYSQEDSLTVGDGRDVGFTKNIKAEFTVAPNVSNLTDENLDSNNSFDKKNMTNETKSDSETDEKKPDLIELNNISREQNKGAIAESIVSSEDKLPIIKDYNNVLATKMDKDIVNIKLNNKVTETRDDSLTVSQSNNSIEHKLDILDIATKEEPAEQVTILNNVKSVDIQNNQSISEIGDTDYNKSDDDLNISTDKVSKCERDVNATNIYVDMSNDEVSKADLNIVNTKATLENDVGVCDRDESKFIEIPIESKKVGDIFLGSSIQKKASNNHVIELLTVTEKDNNTNIRKNTDDYAVSIQANHESGFFYDEEETSDEEPSPEYEPIGAEIAEEFPKYIKSVERTILKGVKDDEKIHSRQETKKQSKINHKIPNESKENSETVLIENRTVSRPRSNDEVNGVDRPTTIETKTPGDENNFIVNAISKDNFDILSTNRYKAQHNHVYNIHQMNIKKELIENEVGKSVTNFPEMLKDPIENYSDRRTCSSGKLGSTKHDTGRRKERLGLNLSPKEIKGKNISSKEVSETVSAVKSDQSTSFNEEVDTKESIMHINPLRHRNDNKNKSKDKHSITKTCISKELFENKHRNKRSKPKMVPLENNVYETYLPEGIFENGSHTNTDTPEIDDDDFDIDGVSINSEDSEISLPTPEKVQVNKRKLRSKQKKPEKSLANPDFIKYLELRQDSLMDEHPELREEEIVAYLYQTWLYEENAKSNTKKSDDVQQSSLVKGLKHERSRKKKSNSPKTRIENYFLPQSNNKMNAIEIKEEIVSDAASESSQYDKLKTHSKVQSLKLESAVDNECEKTDEKNEVKIKEELDTDVPSINLEDGQTSQRTLRSKTISPKESRKKQTNDNKTTLPETSIKEEVDIETASFHSEDIEVPLIIRKLRSKPTKVAETKGNDLEQKDKRSGISIKTEIDAETASINSEDSEMTLNKLRKPRLKPVDKKSFEDPEFIKYFELRRDGLLEDNPQLTQDEIHTYLFKTWLYEENAKSDLKKTDDIEQAGLVKGLQNDVVPQPKRVRKKIKTEKDPDEDDPVVPRHKPKRKSVKPYYNEEYSDIEDEIDSFEVFKSNEKDGKGVQAVCKEEVIDVDGADVIDDVELYFSELGQPKPNVFKGLVREKVCEICEQVGNLVKCKTCNNMFHMECVKKEAEVVSVATPSRGRKKKKKLGRRPKSLEGSESQNDDKSQNVSADVQNMSVEDIVESETHTVDADAFETQLSAKMKEILDNMEVINYDSYSSDDGVDWSDSVAGKCEIVDVKLKRRNIKDYIDFKCNNCQKYDTPVCYVCRSAVSKTDVAIRQKCHVAHCQKYYHLECLDHWPQTQFSEGDPRSNKRHGNIEVMTCPRHVCHTCVSDDPRGCKTRFSADKLARCIKCPATYHSFTKCLPAGSQILTGSHIICPRHYDHRPGKAPCHVNTGWCFICALGGSLICCEYCPTSFHAECLNIKPPEGGYMCEDCETGRLPLYGEMVWVKLGHYRWWPGIILHPCEIPENIMAVKHGLGEFVVRFFGQYDHYWVNRGRVFPFQEGDSGRISSQKSKIDEAFTMAMAHAKRACEILKSAEPNEEESLDIASSLLPPHYVKLKTNKPYGALCGRKVDDPSLSLTQCDCDPAGADPCGPLDHCLNRMLLTECGPACRAGERCGNRALERRRGPRLAPRLAPPRGWGLRALQDIRAGQFVIEYVGELIDEEEFKRRMRRMHEIRDENFYFLTLDKERMIDAGPKGNLARFMNHSCEPNCETQKWTVLGDVRVGLFALHDIPANSEVTFNYNLECAGIDKKRCLCGAKRCSGYIGAKPKQDESQSKKTKECKMPAKRTYKKRRNVDESPSTSKNKPKRPLGRPPKPRELTEIEKDLLIIKNATSAVSSDESIRSLSSSEGDRNPKALKRKRVNFSNEETILNEGPESPSAKKPKLQSEKMAEVGD